MSKRIFRRGGDGFGISDFSRNNGRRERASSVILLPGARYAFNFENDAQMVVGLAAPDFGVFLYFSFEHFFAR